MEKEKAAKALDVDVVIFNIDGLVLEAYCEKGGIEVGHRMARHMSEPEWRYLRKHCLSYDCTRVFVDTRMGGMVVFCQLLSSMHVMIGLICRGEHEVMARYSREKSSIMDHISPRMYYLLRHMTAKGERSTEVLSETAQVAIYLFSAGVLKEELERNAAQAPRIIGETVVRWAQLIGCHVEYRLTGEAVSAVHDFNCNAFMAIMMYLLFFLHRCSSREAVVEVGSLEGRPLIRFFGQLPEGDRDVFVNREYRYGELKVCDGIAEAWQFFFACAAYEHEDTVWFRASFCPKAYPFDGLRVKEPRKSRKPIPREADASAHSETH